MLRIGLVGYKLEQWREAMGSQSYPEERGSALVTLGWMDGECCGQIGAPRLIRLENRDCSDEGNQIDLTV
jgi:hypothetical protein